MLCLRSVHTPAVPHSLYMLGNPFQMLLGSEVMNSPGTYHILPCLTDKGAGPDSCRHLLEAAPRSWQSKPRPVRSFHVPQACDSSCGFPCDCFFLLVSWVLTTLRLFPELWEPGSHLPEVSGAFPAAGWKETLFAHRSSSGLYFFGLLVSISNSGKNKNARVKLRCCFLT